MIKKFRKLKWWQKALLPAWPVFYVLFLAKYGLGALWLARFFAWQALPAIKNKVNQIYRTKSEMET